MSVVVAPAYPPILQFFGNDGTFLVGGQLFTTVGGIPYPTYADSLGQIPHANPIILNSRGEIATSSGQSAQLFLVPGVTYTFALFDRLNNPIDSPSQIQAIPTAATILPLITPGFLGGLLTPPTAAEIATTVAIPAPWYPPGNMLRYGIVPNLADAPTMTSNTAILQGLFSPTLQGPTGLFYFPNTTGADTYSFNAVIPLRDGIHLDLNDCTLSYTGTVGAGDVNSGLFLMLHDFVCENGSISVAVDTTAATGSGRAIYLGARGSDSSYFTVFDASLPVPMGNMVLRNLRLTINNTGTNASAGGAIGATGGLVNVLVENVVIDGSNTTPIGIEYEFGWATSPPSTAATQTSHAHNMLFRNVRIVNLLTTGITDGGGLLLTGAYNSRVEGLYVGGTCWNGFEFRPGEALFFNPWVGVDDVGAKRNIALRGVVVENAINEGLSLVGAESASGGYLATAGLTSGQQTDLMNFTIEDCAIAGTGSALFVSGDLVATNCTFSGANASGNAVVTDECLHSTFINCHVKNGKGVGVRGDFGGAIWSPARQKFFSFSNGLVAGNTGAGIALGNCQTALIARNQFGFNAAYNGAGNETTQTLGVSLDATASNADLDSNFVTVAAGGTAYSLTGTGPRGCNIRNAVGTVSTSGTFDFDDVSAASTAQLSSITSGVNVAPKFLGKQCYNTSSSKMFVAQGNLAGSAWISTDAVTTITPV